MPPYSSHSSAVSDRGSLLPLRPRPLVQAGFQSRAELKASGCAPAHMRKTRGLMALACFFTSDFFLFAGLNAQAARNHKKGHA